jgi:hypothetical protein
MHWLQTLDTSLFLFVNRSLANPVFDWLMPFLSNNAFFFPVLFLLIVGLLWKGNARLRGCPPAPIRHAAGGAAVGQDRQRLHPATD